MVDEIAKPYIIGVVSQKGGVGKTTVAVNLAIGLKLMGYRVLIVDADTSNPSVGLQLGMEDANIGFKELIGGSTTLQEAEVIHGSTGMHTVLGTLHTKPFIATRDDLRRLRTKLKGSSYDLIIIDTAPGFYESEEMDYWNEALLVTTPDTAAVTGILRMNETLNKLKVKHSLVLNRIRRRKYELQESEIEEASDDRLATSIPEDDSVEISLAERIPAYVVDRGSPFSKAIVRLLSEYAKRVKPSQKTGAKKRRSKKPSPRKAAEPPTSTP